MVAPEAQVQVQAQRRNDHVEGLRGLRAGRARVGERLDQAVELEDRAGPSVQQQQRLRPRPAPADPPEVQSTPSTSQRNNGYRLSAASCERQS